MHYSKIEVLNKYTVLKSLSFHSDTLLCKEDATNRLLVIKRFKKDKINFFKSEASALSELASSGICPILYFAHSDEKKNEAIIGMQYKVGRPLLEVVELLSDDLRCRLKEKLKHVVRILHAEYHYAHGDLNPNNIIASEIGHSINLSIIDWEFSEKIRNEDMSNYTKFRGTLGITPNIQENSLMNRDLASIENIFSSLQKKPEVKKAPLLDRLKEWI